jgi:uncharacterized Zn finger protein
VLHPSVRRSEAPAPLVICPHCKDAAGYQLETSSKVALVDYFRCKQCGHVWTLPKPGQDGQSHDITVQRTSDAPQN